MAVPICVKYVSVILKQLLLFKRLFSFVASNLRRLRRDPQRFGLSVLSLIN